MSHSALRSAYLREYAETCISGLSNVDAYRDPDTDTEYLHAPDKGFLLSDNDGFGTGGRADIKRGAEHVEAYLSK